MYTCKSSRELTDEQMLALARGLNCTIGYQAKVKNQDRWDYKIEKKELTPQDKRLLLEFGLQPLWGPKGAIDPKGFLDDCVEQQTQNNS